MNRKQLRQDSRRVKRFYETAWQQQTAVVRSRIDSTRIYKSGQVIVEFDVDDELENADRLDSASLVALYENAWRSA